MKKLRLGAMAITVAVAVGAFVGAQRLDWIPGPWSKDRISLRNLGKSVSALSQELGLESEPAGFMDFYRRRLAFQRRHQYEHALADLNEAVKLSPTPRTAEDLGQNAFNSRLPETHTLNMVVLVHTARADILQQMNRPNEALADLDQAIALDSRGSSVIHSRGLLRTYAGQYDGAIADFNLLLNRRTDPQWVFARGVAHYFKADWANAANDFAWAARLMPQKNAHLIWLTKTFLRVGQPLPPQPFANMDSASPTGAMVAAFMSDQQPQRGAVAETQLAGRCPAALFVGEWLTIRKSGQGAREMFTEAASACRPLSLEHATAMAELARLPQQ